MSNDDALAKRGRTHEDEYFRKKDQELVERMRRAAAEAETREGLSTRTGLDDPEMLQELQALGFTPDTVSLLPILPLVQVAWAEGGVTEAERHAVNDLARARGIAEGSAAARQLADWLTNQPDAQVFSRGMRLIGAVLEAQGHESGALTADDLVKYCETIARASGGVFGIKKISGEELALIASLAADLKERSSV
jgi:hypothetical protein